MAADWGLTCERADARRRCEGLGDDGAAVAAGPPLVIWSPVNGLHLRGNYGRSVRAPNQSELFSPFSQNFAPAFGDPCSSANLAQGSANRAANCAAAGRPGGTDATLNPSPRADGTINLTAPYDYRYQSSLEIRSGGNPLLEAEKSDSLTLGLVATPAFLPGFSFSVDY